MCISMLLHLDPLTFDYSERSSEIQPMFTNCQCDSCSLKKVFPHHCDSTAAHLTRFISEITKLLKDSSDSGYREACRDMIGVLSEIYLKGYNLDAAIEPLFEAMGQHNEFVQSGAAMCMARIVESAASPPVTYFQKLCPRICKLLSNPCFLAKPSLLLVISNLSQVGAIEPESLDSLLGSIEDCLASTSWETRKAAADTLTALASHSSNLIKDKTDFTLAVLENCQLDKIEAVRESVTEALLLWKNISWKCVDIASLEESNSSSSCEKMSDLADVMNKDASNGSTLSQDSATKDKGGLPGKNEAVVTLAKKTTPAFSDRDCSSGFSQRRESGIHDLCSPEYSNPFKDIQAGDHGFFYTKYPNLESASDKQVNGKFDGNGSRLKPSGDYGRAPGDRDLPFDAATKGRLCMSDMAPLAASRNGQGWPRSLLSEQHENEHMGNGTRGRDNEASETTRFSQGPSATLGAVNRVAGEDGTVTRPTPVATGPEAKAMGDQVHNKKEPAWLAPLLNDALKSFRAGDVNAAYAEILFLGVNGYSPSVSSVVLNMMKMTGPCLDRMSDENANEALNFMAHILLCCEHSKNRPIFNICVSWIQQLVELLLKNGSETFGVPSKLKDNIMYNLWNAYPRDPEDEDPPLIVELSSAWDTAILSYCEVVTRNVN